jgi:endonuclease/exonuclease/phosphatase (EEP) superfamily protein YafD
MLLHNSKEPGCRWRILGSFLLVVTMMFAWSISPAKADFNDPSIKVMTQNMDAGTDLGFFFYYASQGRELIQAMNLSPYPVILAGDFNSDAEQADFF